MKNIFIIAIALFTTFTFAQNKRTLTLNKETNQIDVVYYHEDGKVSQTGSYTADGKLHGEWISYNNAGKAIVKAYYKDGKKVGKWIHVVDGIAKEVDYTKNVASL